MIKTERYLLFYMDFGQLKMVIKNAFVKEDFKEVLNVQEDWQPIGDDKLYFFPGCVVPRFKVRDKYSCTIKPANATAAFVSTTEIKKGSVVEVIENASELDLDEAMYLVNSSFNPGEKIFERFMNFKDQVKGAYIDKSIIESWYAPAMNMNYSFNDMVDNSKYYYKQAQESLYCVTPASGINDLKCPVYFEVDILKFLNEDQIIIDANKYQELRAFGLSIDQENLILMTELMANADFEKSFVYLLFLLKEFGKNILPTKAVDHVNFKSLLIYLGISKKQIANIQLKDLTASLQKHGKFTRTNVQRITSLCADDVINYEHLHPMYQEGPVLRADSENLLDS